MLILGAGCVARPIPRYVGPKNGMDVYVDLQGGFDGERVEVLYNGMLVYDGRPKTDYTLGLAASVNFKVATGTLGTLTIVVDEASLARTIDWKDGRYIFVSNPPRQFSQATEPCGYD